MSILSSLGAKLFDNAAASVANSPNFVLPVSPCIVAWQYSFGTNPSAVTIQILTSVDGVNYFVTDSASVVGGTIKTFVTAARFIRARINSITGGAGVTVDVIVKRISISRNNQLIQRSLGSITAPNSTTENVLATISLPPLVPNSQVRIYTLWSVVNNANAKTPRFRFGGPAGTVINSVNLANQASWQTLLFLNILSLNSQLTFGGANAIAASNAANIASAVDVSVPSELVISVQKGTAGDSVVLENYLVETYVPG